MNNLLKGVFLGAANTANYMRDQKRKAELELALRDELKKREQKRERDLINDEADRIEQQKRDAQMMVNFITSFPSQSRPIPSTMMGMGPIAKPFAVPSPFVPEAQKRSMAADVVYGLPKETMSDATKKQYLEAKGLGPTEPEKENFQIVQNAKGEFILIPKNRTGTPRSTGVMGAPKGSLVTVNTGDTIPVPKSSQSKLFNDLTEADQQIQDFNRIEQLWNPKFSTLGFQADSWITAKYRRLGEGKLKGAADFVMPKYVEERIAKMPAEQQQYQQWVHKTSIAALIMRKFITGVAGGEKEMEQILGVLPNVKDDPLAYWAKLQEWKLAATKKRDYIEDLLVNGRKYNPKFSIDDIDNQTLLGLSKKAVLEAQSEIAQIPLNQFGQPSATTIGQRYPGVRF